MKIGSVSIENGGVPYVIAEIGANHNGRLDLAKKLIDQAKEAGCDSAKFQSWTKDSIFSKKVYEENHFLSDDYRNRKDHTLESIVDAYSVSQEDFYQLKKHCDQVRIGFSCTPFSKAEADFLVDELHVEFVKIASMDLNNYPFLDYVARKGKPIALSTGMSTLAEIDTAVRTIEAAGNRQIIILHCVAVYPPKDENVHLNNMQMLRDNFPEYPIGFSDHSIGTAVPLAAIALGACMIEKHMTLDKNMEGWDHKISATPDELKEIVESGRKIRKALGQYRRVLSPDDYRQIPAFRRSVVAARPIRKDQKITREDLDTKRPGTGIEPRFVDFLVGRTAKRDISFDEMIGWEDF